MNNLGYKLSKSLTIFSGSYSAFNSINLFYNLYRSTIGNVSFLKVSNLKLKTFLLSSVLY